MRQNSRSTFNRKFKRKNSSTSSSPKQIKKGKNQHLGMALEIDNEAFRDKNNESVTIDVNTVKQRLMKEAQTENMSYLMMS